MTSADCQSAVHFFYNALAEKENWRLELLGHPLDLIALNRTLLTNSPKASTRGAETSN